MCARHVAYGLDLRCSFALPGMPAAAADELPTVALELVSAVQLREAWSGASGRYSWRGTLGDGCTLTIDSGDAGDLLFSYQDRARFLLDRSGQVLLCAVLQEGLHWQQVLLGRVLPDVALARGYEALHASALASPAGVVALAAPSGMGKTTLALELMRRGWPLFADDVLVLGDDGPGSVVAHPGTPHMNVAIGASDACPGLGETLGTLGEERWVAASRSASEAMAPRTICLLERGRNLTLQAQKLPASPLPLAPYMLGLDDDAERERRRFELYADMLGTATLVRIAGGLDATPAQLADLVECALAEQTQLAAEGAR